jgi:hypothetical protein
VVSWVGFFRIYLNLGGGSQDLGSEGTYSASGLGKGEQRQEEQDLPQAPGRPFDHLSSLALLFAFRLLFLLLFATAVSQYHFNIEFTQPGCCATLMVTGEPHASQDRKRGRPAINVLGLCRL